MCVFIRVGFQQLTSTSSFRQLGNLTGKVEEYERLLRDLSLRVGGQDRDLIRKVVDKVNFPETRSPVN